MPVLIKKDVFVLRSNAEVRHIAQHMAGHAKRRGQGRPPEGTKTPLTIRLSKVSVRNLMALKATWGWSKVATVERALAFAASHPDFSAVTSTPK
jgi:hypothetical protein